MRLASAPSLHHRDERGKTETCGGHWWSFGPASFRRMDILVPPHGLVESLTVALLQPDVDGRALPHAHGVAKFIVCPAPHFLWE